MAKAYASLTINLSPKDVEDGEGTDENASISLELDDSLNIDAEGEPRSQFGFGEAIYIRCFRQPSDLELRSAEITDGSVSGPSGDYAVNVEDESVTFSNSDTANTSKPITGGFSYRWLGTSLGALVVTADGSLKASQVGTAVALASYASNYSRIVASVPPRDDPIPYPVIVSVAAVE
jgi:hypothetical protein